MLNDNVGDQRDPNVNEVEHRWNNRGEIVPWLTGTIWTLEEAFQKVRRGGNNPSVVNYASETVVVRLLGGGSFKRSDSTDLAVDRTRRRDLVSHRISHTTFR